MTPALQKAIYVTFKGKKYLFHRRKQSEPWRAYGHIIHKKRILKGYFRVEKHGDEHVGVFVTMDKLRSMGVR